MSEVPTFSILLPAKGRPDLVRDALLSLLEQSYHSFEIILSNNGADKAVREAVADKLSDPRIQYLEQADVLPMPQHWEQISLLARGRYLMVVPDRSVLKQGALARVADLHDNGGDKAAIVTWSWDLYFNESNILLPFAGTEVDPQVLDSENLALDSLRVQASYPSALPRGLNSSVARYLVDEIRSRNGTAFSSINPDFSFAYDCLMCCPQVTYLNNALMISQGLSVSNGGNAYRTDASGYVGTLGLKEPIRYSPIKTLFVENIIAEDFFSACHRFDRLDTFAKFDIANLYLKCFAELEEKRSVGVLLTHRLEELSKSLESALALESLAIKLRVDAARAQRTKLKDRVRRFIKKQLGRNAQQLQPLILRLRGGKRFSSILAASGHRTA